MKKPSRGKYQYTVEADRVIYVIHAPGLEDFFVWHCLKDRWKACYKSHLLGKHSPTADFIKQCKRQSITPCFHILEEVHLTQVMAYRHVIAWTEILYRKGFEPLVGIKTLFYMTEMNEYTQSVFDRNKKADLTVLLSCEACLVNKFLCSQCQSIR